MQTNMYDDYLNDDCEPFLQNDDDESYVESGDEQSADDQYFEQNEVDGKQTFATCQNAEQLQPKLKAFLD